MKNVYNMFKIHWRNHGTILKYLTEDMDVLWRVNFNPILLSSASASRPTQHSVFHETPHINDSAGFISFIMHLFKFKQLSCLIQSVLIQTWMIFMKITWRLYYIVDWYSGTICIRMNSYMDVRDDGFSKVCDSCYECYGNKTVKIELLFFAF